MKITITDPSGVPEGLKTLVQTEGEESTLDLSKLVPVSKYEDAQSKYLSVKDEAQSRRHELKAWKDLGDTPDAVRQAIEDANKDGDEALKTKLEAAETKLASIGKDHEAALAEKDQRIMDMHRSNVAASLKTELATAGFIPESVNDIATAAMARLELGDDGGIKVMTVEGTPMVGNGPDHGATLADLAKELAEAKPYAVRDGGLPGGGKPPSKGGTPENNPWKPETLNLTQQATILKSDPKKAAALMAEAGQS